VQNIDSYLIEVTLNEIPVENATVTLSYDNDLLWVGLSNSSGHVDIPVSADELSRNDLTVSKRGELPIQQLTDYIPPEDTPAIPGYNFGLIPTILLGLVILTLKIRYKKKQENPNR